MSVKLNIGSDWHVLVTFHWTWSEILSKASKVYVFSFTLIFFFIFIENVEGTPTIGEDAM